MPRKIIALLLLAGCQSEEFLPAGSERACLTRSYGTVCAVSYELCDDVREDDVEAMLNDGMTEEQLEDDGMIYIVPLVAPLDQLDARTVTDGPALSFWVQPGTSTNVYYYPAESKCFDVATWTDGSDVALYMYWQKYGSTWIHWRTIHPMAKSVTQYTRGVWSNADNYAGAAIYRFKFSDHNVKAKQVSIDITVLSGDVDCLNYP